MKLYALFATFALACNRKPPVETTETADAPATEATTTGDYPTTEDYPATDYPADYYTTENP